METLGGVAVGDVIYYGRRFNDLTAVTVEKVGKIHVTANGLKFNKDSGRKVGPRDRRTSQLYARKATPEILAAIDQDTALRGFERALAAFRAVPQTAERLRAATLPLLDGVT